MGMPNPMMGNGPIPNNPFLDSNPFDNMNSGFGGMASNPFEGGGGDIDVDDLLKKIDAKIAELEEEEKKEKEASIQTNNKVDSKLENEIEELEFNLDDKEKTTNSNIETFDINADISNKGKTFNEIISANSNVNNKSENKVTDDEFFDDFFQDEQ